MIITAEEYFSKLHLTLNENPPAYAILPNVDNVYSINGKTREIQSPSFLGVERDHKSRTIYFSIDRKIDFMDLSQTWCNIHYKNLSTGLEGIYIVPFYDIFTMSKEGKILIPWNLDATVLSAAGTVQFSFHFYKIGEKTNVTGEKEKIITYILNTQYTSSRVLKGMEVKDDIDTDSLVKPTPFETLNQRIDEISQYNRLYWTILD